MNEKDIIALYRKQVESSNETPPDTCWDEINTQLYLDDQWESIAMELNTVLPLNYDIKATYSGNTRSLLTRFITIVIPLVFILLMIPSDIRKSNLVTRPLEEYDISAVPIDRSSSVTSTEKAPLISGQEHEDAKDFSKNGTVQQPENLVPEIALTAPVPANKETIAQKDDNSVTNPETGLTTLKPDPVNEKITSAVLKIKDTFIRDTLSPFQQIAHAVVLTPSLFKSPVSLPVTLMGNELTGEGSFPPGTNIKRNKFSVGISLSEKNTWLINQETFDGLDRQKLSSTKAKFLNDIGIIFRYTHSERWSFEGSCFLFSKTGQSYRQYLNGIYNSKSYELKYFSFEFSARHTFHRSLKINNVNFYSVTGAYISHLNSAYKRIGHSLYNISADFDPVDWGVLIGYEAEITLFSRFALAPGFHLKLGIPNIYADQPGIPDELHSTRNASLEFRLNLILPLSNY